MSPSWYESAVSLDKLDNHLKALLRLKIREFVHLSPWFKEEPIAPPELPTPGHRRFAPPVVLLEEPECPHRKHDGRIGRRYVRSSLHLTGVR